MRIRYHQPIPNFYKVENPVSSFNSISDDLLDELRDFILVNGFAGMSFSKLSDDFKDHWGIDWDNIIILKFILSVQEYLDFCKSRMNCTKGVFGKKIFLIKCSCTFFI